MSDSNAPAPADFCAYAKAVFFKWEKLRIAYNVLLIGTLAVVMLTTPGIVQSIRRDPAVLVHWLLYGVAANCCFFAGPAVETYAAWLGLKSRWITMGLFLAGIVISIPLVLFTALATTGLLLPEPD